MRPFHDRYQSETRINLPVRIEDTPTNNTIPVLTATHDRLVLSISDDASLAATDLTGGYWYQLTDVLVVDDADHDLRITADTTIDEDGATVNDWLGGLAAHNDARLAGPSSGHGHWHGMSQQSTGRSSPSDTRINHVTTGPQSTTGHGSQLSSSSPASNTQYGTHRLRPQHTSTSGRPDPSNTLGFATGGGKDVNNFRDHITDDRLPHPDAITYEGLFYDYYFDTGHRRDRDSLFYPTYSQALTTHPLTGDREHYLSVGLASNLTEDMLERPPLDLLAVVDVSGSMDQEFSDYYYDEHGRRREADGETTTRKIEAARDALAAMTKHLRPEDRFSVILYNTKTKVAKPIRSVEETDMDAVRDGIRDLEATGGTNMEAGFDAAIDELTECVDPTPDSERESRVLFFTDAMPNEGGTAVDDLETTFADAADRGIHTTFIGVGIDANPELVDALSGIRGANHYFMQSVDEFTDRMVDEFPYMVTPLVFDLTLTVEGDGYDIDTVYGSPNTDETTGDVMQVKTLFPSPSDDGASRGGVILVKLTANERASEVRLSCSWKERDGTEDADVIRVDIPDTSSTTDQFDTPTIRKAVLLARYGELLRDWLTEMNTPAGTSETDTETDTTDDSPGHEFLPPRGLDREGDLNQWERQSTPLVVPDEYREKFDAFRSHFDTETDAIGDPDLEQELEVLKILATTV